jgi:D-inositol-3-phosphate glycosyltransferase
VRKLVRWLVSPLAWRGTARLGARAGFVRERWRRAMRSPWKEAQVARTGERGEPSGWLFDRPWRGRTPLFSAVHPVTGDQLLSTNPHEAVELGYGQPTRLGFILASAPITGVLATRRSPLPWASRVAFDRDGAGAAAMGAITRPTADKPVPRDALRVSGWAVLGPEPVNRVEILLYGRKVANARLGLQRLGRERPANAPEAPVSGFDYSFSPAQIPAEARSAHIEAVVTGRDGTELVLSPSGRVPLAPALPIPEQADLPPAAAEPFRRMLAERSGSAPDGLRLAAFTHTLSAGGAQRYLFEQLKRLNAADDLLCSVIAAEGGPWERRFEEAGMPVHVVGDYPVAGRASYEAKIAHLGRWASGRRIDAVFANTFDAFIAVDMAHRLELPSVWAIHESYELPVWWRMFQGDRPDAYIRERSLAALRRCSALIFVAEATKKLYEPYSEEERMIAAPLGIELTGIEEFKRSTSRDAAREALGFAPDETVILCLSIIEPRKCQAVLARAWAQASPKHPNARLVLVGDIASPYCKGIHEFVESAGLSDVCRIMPVTNEPYSWHLAADYFALVSDVESSPIAVIEAMAFGTPVLATEVFGLPEMIRHGETGFLCPPNDVGRLAEALDEILALEPADREAIGRAAARAVRERHDPDRYAASLDRLIRGLVRGEALVPTKAWDDAAATRSPGAALQAAHP